MFSIGEQVIYEASGVYRIDDIAPSSFDKTDRRMYYVLKPVISPDHAVIFMPVDSKKAFMRRLLTVDEVNELIERMPFILTLQIPEQRLRKDAYRQAMMKRDPVEYIKLIKTVHMRRRELASVKKPLPDTDQEYEQKAKQCVYSEFSMVLGIPLHDVEDYITRKIDAL